MDLERFKILGKLRGAFSVAEMLVVMLVLSIVIISMTPVMVKRVKKEAANPDHGTFECFWDKENGKDVLIERIRNARGEIVSKKERTKDEYCSFTPKRGAMFFTVNAVGGGSPGAGMMNDLPSDWRDYTIDFTQFKGFDVLETKDNKVDIIGQTFDNLPDIIKNNLSIPLKVILASSGGDFGSGNAWGGGYHTHTRLAVPGCEKESLPDFRKVDFKTYEGDEYVDKYHTATTKCFLLSVYPGRDPKPGGRLLMSGSNITASQGDTIKHTEFNAAEPGFSLKNSSNVNYGCKVSKGGEGFQSRVIYTLNPTVADARRGVHGGSGKCDSVSSFEKDRGYAPKKYTMTEENFKDSGTEFTCQYSDSEDCGVGKNQLSKACDWCIEDKPAPPTEYNLTVWGRFATVLKTRSKGVNFYGPAGNPGEFKTIYVSRFTNNVRIIPGAPKPVENGAVGNSTTICYLNSAGTNCGTTLLTALGGKAPRVNNDTSKDFIVGSMFNLSETGQVIAYNDTVNNLKDPSESNYGHYFKTKESGFVYPVPDSENTIPSTAGQGGHGAYTIFRKAGKSNAFELWKTKFVYNDYVEKVTNVGQKGEKSGSKYTCVSNNRELYENDYFCTPGGGHGGAVVITW